MLLLLYVTWKLQLDSSLVLVLSQQMPQAAQTLNWSVNDCVTILAVHKTMYENAAKIALNATWRR